MKSNEYKLMQLHRINDRFYEFKVNQYKRGIISFEVLLKHKKTSTNIQKLIKKLDSSFGTPLPWMYVYNGIVR